MCFKRRHSVPIVFLTSPRGRIRHVVFTCSSHRDTYFQFTIHFTLAHFFAFSLICLSYINKLFVMKISCLLPRAKLLRVTFFMKRSYLLPRENFKLPYLPNQAYWDPGICTQLRSSHIHSIHPNRAISSNSQGHDGFPSNSCWTVYRPKNIGHFGSHGQPCDRPYHTTTNAG